MGEEMTNDSDFAEFDLIVVFFFLLVGGSTFPFNGAVIPGAAYYGQKKVVTYLIWLT